MRHGCFHRRAPDLPDLPSWGPGNLVEPSHANPCLLRGLIVAAAAAAAWCLPQVSAVWQRIREGQRQRKLQEETAAAAARMARGRLLSAARRRNKEHNFVDR